MTNHWLLRFVLKFFCANTIFLLMRALAAVELLGCGKSISCYSISPLEIGLFRRKQEGPFAPNLVLQNESRKAIEK